MYASMCHHVLAYASICWHIVSDASMCQRIYVVARMGTLFEFFSKISFTEKPRDVGAEVDVGTYGAPVYSFFSRDFSWEVPCDSTWAPS